MYVLKHRFTGMIYAAFATYDAAFAIYDMERADNLLVDMYEIPDEMVVIPMERSHRIVEPHRDSVDRGEDAEKYSHIMGLGE